MDGSLRSRETAVRKRNIMAKVSVIVPNYNHARFLQDRLESIFAQTYTDYEVIILDDCSADGSREIIEGYRSHPKVAKIIYNNQNSGSPFKQWNKGVAVAAGEYVWIAESDDLARPELLATLVASLDADRNVGLAYVQSERIDEHGKVSPPCFEWTDAVSPTRWRGDYLDNGRRECGLSLAIRNTVPNASAVVFRKDIYQMVGGADEHSRLCGDWIAWTRILGSSNIAFHANPLNFHRWHADTVRSTSGGRRTMHEFALARRTAFYAAAPHPVAVSAVESEALADIRRETCNMQDPLGGLELARLLWVYRFLRLRFVVLASGAFAAGRATLVMNRCRIFLGRIKREAFAAKPAEQ